MSRKTCTRLKTTLQQSSHSFFFANYYFVSFNRCTVYLCQTIQSETRFEFWICKAHQNKLYYYCYLCHLHIIILYIGMWYIRTYYRTIGRPTVWKKKIIIIMLLSPAIRRNANSLSGQIARDFLQMPVWQSPPPKYNIRTLYDDVQTIIVISYYEGIHHTIHYGL